MRYRGNWWLPKFENNKFTGVLNFTGKNGGRLSINGNVSSELYSDQEFHSNNDKIILGQYTRIYI